MAVFAAAVAGVDGADAEALMAERTEVSALFAEAAELLATPDPSRISDYAERIQVITHGQQEKIDELHSK